MIKLLLIVRYKFRYMVPNIPPFVGSLYVVKRNTNFKELSIRNSLIPKLKYFTGTVGLMQSTTKHKQI